MLNKKTLLPFFLIFLSSVVVANETTGAITITLLENFVASEGVFVRGDEPALTIPAGCPITDKYNMASSASNISRSMLLGSLMAGKQIILTIYGGGCSANRPQVVAVSFKE